MVAVRRTAEGSPPRRSDPNLDPGRNVKILLLCEGDPETHDSWSGVTRSLLLALREAGHEVIAGDVELYHAARLWNAVRSIRWSPRRWRMWYRLGDTTFHARSRRAHALLKKHGDSVDLILQIGATFEVDPGETVPLYLYCDSNIELASHAAYTGVTEASPLTAAELAAIRRREAEVYARARVIFTMSDQLRDSFQSDFDLDGDRLVTVHCGPNTRIPDGATPEREPDHPPTILFIGRDFARKGGALLLEALPRVREEIPDARLVMVGPEAVPGDPPEVERLGYLDRDTPEGAAAMDRAYRDATLFCLPTRFDPFGTAFVEAMYYGLPCVGPHAWAVPEIILDGETGRLFPPEDADGLAEALIDLLSRRERAREMGRAARKRVLKHFTWPGIVKKMEASITRTLDRSGVS
jgi:alpha-maltose-1-phosphate synthase